MKTCFAAPLPNGTAASRTGPGGCPDYLGPVTYDEVSQGGYVQQLALTRLEHSDTC